MVSKLSLDKTCQAPVLMKIFKRKDRCTGGCFVDSFPLDTYNSAETSSFHLSEWESDKTFKPLRYDLILVPAVGTSRVRSHRHRCRQACTNQIRIRFCSYRDILKPWAVAGWNHLSQARLWIWRCLSRSADVSCLTENPTKSISESCKSLVLYLM